LTSPSEPIIVFTDGACSGNPGPGGYGVVLRAGGTERTISGWLGDDCTNNIAELTAILRALEAIRDPSRPVHLYSDSAYALGLLTQNWKAKANTELVMTLRRRAREFPRLKLIKIEGHAGHEGNELADRLARAAIVNRATTDEYHKIG
jgi:ribonuclease HI